MANFPNFDESTRRSQVPDQKLEYLKDLHLNVYIELGRTKMQIKDILELERGYVIELEKLASEPVDVFVNNKKIAEGEVVVIDKHFGIRITNLVEAADRIKGF
ncbi:MAG: flagellar motor switch protein FliN [Ignavibacteriales bacterium]|nr:flagellar motor switch protein FliN [Ignavibacteriales bacterium]